MDKLEEQTVKANIRKLCEIRYYERAAELLMNNFVLTKLTKEQLEPIPDLQENLALYLKEGKSDIYGHIDLIIELAKGGNIKSKRFR